MNKEIDNVFVEKWMIDEYKLKGNELILFSIITGSPFEDKLYFECSLDLLCKNLCCSKTNVYKLLNNLKKKNLIKIIKSKKSDEEVYKILNKKNSPTGCLFCGYDKFDCLDKHHYPIRHKNGGTETINLCPNCHRRFHVMAGDVCIRITIKFLKGVKDEPQF